MQEAHKKEVEKEEAAYEKKREGESGLRGFYSGFLTKNTAMGHAAAVPEKPEPKQAFKNVMEEKIEQLKQKRDATKQQEKMTV